MSQPGSLADPWILEELCPQDALRQERAETYARAVEGRVMSCAIARRPITQDPTPGCGGCP